MSYKKLGVSPKEFKEHEKKIASDEELGHVKIGDGIEVEEDGTISVGEVDLTELEEHIEDKENPHEVTKEQVGLGNVKDEEQATKEEFDEHVEKKATEEEAGHVTVGEGLNVDDGKVSVKFATEDEATSGQADDVAMTPKGTAQYVKKISGESAGSVQANLDEHIGTKGSFGEYGHVKLSNHTTSSSSVYDGVAATPYAVKAVNDRIGEHEEKIASEDELGHVKVGRGLTIDEDGRLNVPFAPTIYGVEIDEDNPDPFGRVKYIADSEGFEPLYSGDGTVNYGSWKYKFPINKVKVVLLKDGEVVEELDKNDHRKTVDGRTVDITSGDSGDVMVGIPLTYWKFERVGSKLRIYVSEHEIDDSFKAYAHSRDGIVQDDYLYIGAYKGSVQGDKLRSLHDVMSTGEETIGKFREYAENNGEGYGQMNWATLTLFQIFTVLLSKSTDSQTALGRGYVDGNDDYIKNGGTTDKGLFHGESTDKKQMKFLGIEDFWGNRFEYVDGLVRKDDKFWTNTSNTNYNNDAVGYTEAGNAPNFDDYFKTVIGTTESGFIPAERGGSSSTYYCDYYWYNSGHRVVAFGSSLNDGSMSGAFRLNALVLPAITNENRGARLLYLKGGN